MTGAMAATGSAAGWARVVAETEALAAASTVALAAMGVAELEEILAAVEQVEQEALQEAGSDQKESIVGLQKRGNVQTVVPPPQRT